MRTLYTERRKALATAIESTMNRYVEIRLQDWGMHFVAWLHGGLSDAEIVEHLRRKGIGLASLSRCSLKVSGHNGLMIHQCSKGECGIGHTPDAGRNARDLRIRYFEVVSAVQRSAPGVRRDKAALSSGCKSHPATTPAGSNRSSYGGDEIAEAFGKRVTNW